MDNNKISNKDILKNGLFAACKLIDNLCGVERCYENTPFSKEYVDQRLKLVEGITEKIEEYLISAGNPRRELLSSLKD